MSDETQGVTAADVFNGSQFAIIFYTKRAEIWPATFENKRQHDLEMADVFRAVREWGTEPRELLAACMNQSAENRKRTP